MGCTDADPIQNRDVFAKVDSDIVYQAPEGAALNQYPAYQPVAVSQISATAFIYLDRQTRNVVRFDTTTGEREIVLELAAYEDALNPEIAFMGLWGASLIKRPNGWFLVAAPNRALLAFHIDSRQVQIIGDTQQSLPQPRSGMSLSQISFSQFSGIGQGESGLYVAFNNQIFLIPETAANSVNTLIHTPMIHVAGATPSEYSTASSDTHQAHLAKLRIGAFTELTEIDQRLFF